MEKLAPYYKAVLAFIAPAAVVVIASLQAGSDGGSAITVAEWITAAATAIITASGVYAVPNRPSAERANDPLV